ncbi:DUF1565 domain-containing protein, partial [candidate division KSB1 bacterium]
MCRYFSLAFLLVVLNAVTFGQAGFTTRTGTSVMEVCPNYYSMSLELSYQGDDDADNVASFVYRMIGEDKWLNGVDMTPFRDSKLWRAAIFPLEPGTAYEIVATVEDADGVREETIAQAARTRPVITEAGDGPTVYVSHKGVDNNPGTKRKPFKTIGRAVESVRAGGTVIVAP